MGFPPAFPLQDGSARDVWAFILNRDVTYPDHYDRAAYAIGDVSPHDYDDTRMSGSFFEFLDLYAYYRASAWRHLDLSTRKWEE
jgi:3'-phosphoadenosine 5'-phosphosulfate sulfotransferase (PAPS reductase)/FAD synthetase